MVNAPKIADGMRAPIRPDSVRAHSDGHGVNERKAATDSSVQQRYVRFIEKRVTAE